MCTEKGREYTDKNLSQRSILTAAEREEYGFSSAKHRALRGKLLRNRVMRQLHEIPLYFSPHATNPLSVLSLPKYFVCATS